MHKMTQIFLVFFCILLMTFSLATEGYAKRFGGGKSFGIARNSSSYGQRSRSFSSQQQNNAARIANRPQSMLRSFLAPIAGFVLGGLLASLFMGHGLGSGIISWIVLIGAGYLLWQFVRSKQSPITRVQPSTAPYAPLNDNMNMNAQEVYANTQSFGPANDTINAANEMDMNEVDFLREAKVLFLRLQAAYDCKNLRDLRTFTSPEVFAEIQLQFAERGEEENITNVISLDAEMLGCETIMREITASVHFSGMIKENKDQEANHFSEIWHFSKNKDHDADWRVAGIQQQG